MNRITGSARKGLLALGTVMARMPTKACAGAVSAGLVMALGLTACGADAPPRAPEPAPPPGVSVTGDARVGVVIGGS